MWEYNYTLCHYGIRGQRWGERNFQNEDGSLTPAGRIRYGIGQGLKKTNTTNKKITNASLDRLHKKQENYELKKQYKQEKKEFKDQKTLDKIAKRDARGKKVSRKELKLREKYLNKKGMTEEQAKIAAYRKTKTKKFIKRASLLTLGAASAYGFHKLDGDFTIEVQGRDILKISNYHRSRGSNFVGINTVGTFIDLLSGDPLGALLWW